MINVLGFSKDRAAQLDLALSTYKKYFKEAKNNKIRILCKATNTFYENGYVLLKKYHPEVELFREDSFKTNILNIFNNSEFNYVSFITDDDVFVDEMSLEDPIISEFFRNEEITCVTPRVAPYVNFCYPAVRKNDTTHINENGTYKWQGLFGDWGYPMSLSTHHIFRKSDLSFLNSIDFKCPNTMEGAMCGTYPTNRPYMICYKTARCITAVNNRVQTYNNNVTENSHPIDELNEMFLCGNRLSPDANDKYIINMAHAPLKYIWEQK